MSVDVNGRTHRPKGLPKGVAGTYAAGAAARGDTDLDESPYRLDGDESRAEATRLTEEWLDRGLGGLREATPTGGSIVTMTVNRNTGGVLLVSDHGRVTDLLPLGVDDDGVRVRVRDYGRIPDHRIGDARRGMFDEAWASVRPARRQSTEWEAVVRMDDAALFGPQWDATPVWGAMYLTVLDDPSKPCPDWDDRDSLPGMIEERDPWRIGDNDGIEGVDRYADDLFDDRAADRWRREFVADQTDLQEETLGPLPRRIRAAYEHEYGVMFDRALKERRVRVESLVGGMLRSPDALADNPMRYGIAATAARSRSVELRDAALDSGLLDMGDVRRLADDPEPLVAAHARRILYGDASHVA